jgi:hypothetical protein
MYGSECLSIFLCLLLKVNQIRNSLSRFLPVNHDVPLLALYLLNVTMDLIVCWCGLEEEHVVSFHYFESHCDCKGELLVAWGKMMCGNLPQGSFTSSDQAVFIVTSSGKLRALLRAPQHGPSVYQISAEYWGQHDTKPMPSQSAQYLRTSKV